MINYKFSENEYQKLINNLKYSIQNNNAIIEKANQIDLRHSNIKVDIEKINRIIDEFKNDNINNNKDLETYIIEYNGDVYLTIQLCLLAILNKIQMTLDTNYFMLAMNNIIVEIFNRELQKYDIKGLLKIQNSIDFEDMEELPNKILCIDCIDAYNELEYEEFENIELIKYSSIDLYCDDDELVELRNMICDFARNNKWELEIYDDHDRKIAAEMIEKYGEASNVVLLSNDKELQEEFKNKITSKNLYINKIPLNEFKKINI